MSSNITYLKKYRPNALDDGAESRGYQRNNRYFKLRNEWYFIAREKVALGPFLSLEGAESGLSDYLYFLDIAPKTLVDKLRGGPKSFDY